MGVTPDIGDAGVSAAIADALRASAGAGVCIIDRELRYVWVNETLARMNGRPASAHVGRPIREVLPAQAADLLLPLLARVVETGEPVVDMPAAFDDPSGGRREFLSSYRAVRDGDRITGVAAIVVEHVGGTDTARVAAERLRRVAESGIVGVFFWTVDGGVSEANDAFLDLLGYTRDDLAAGRVDWRAMTPPRWAKSDEQAVAELMATGSHGPYPKEYVARDGRPVAVVVTSAFLDGAHERGVCVCIDDRARRAAEESLARALHDAERSADRISRLQMLTAALAGAQTVEDVADLVVTGVVEAAGARTGLLAMRAPGTDDAIVLRRVGLPESTGQRYAVLRSSTPGITVQALLSGEPQWAHSLDELSARFPELRETYAELGVEGAVALPLSVAGEVVGVMTCTFTEPRAFTDEEREFFLAFARQAAVAIERARLFTAEREALAAAEHARTEAEQARAAAEAASRAKSQFLATMSHELRTPLNAIGGYAELMEMGLRGPVSSQQVEDLARIQRSQQHLLGLINEVLNYARLESGSVRYELADVGVAGVLGAVESLVLPQARGKGVALTFAPCEPSLAVRADAEKLRQVLLNLLSNAIKFTDAEGTIHVACRAGGARVSLEVSDTGVGIAPDQLEAIFEPFVQVGRALNRPGEGTGLGLAISRDLARGMGGDLTVESTPGVGSRFTLVLPRA